MKYLFGMARMPSVYNVNIVHCTKYTQYKHLTVLQNIHKIWRTSFSFFLKMILNWHFYCKKNKIKKKYNLLLVYPAHYS